ncbi:MAG: peroxiredoxin [Moraxellaceae bacterium]|nr:MAG: peroxiredoxin [Moraxellaceae bacterium]
MKNKLVIGLLSAIIASPAFAALKAGDKAPEFKIPASFAGKASEFSLKEHLKKGSVVVYFYPSAYTRGCNIQAHTFSVNSDKFTAAGATVVGVSLDNIERLNEFSADPEFYAGKFPVASDAKGKVAKSFELDVKEAAEGKVDTRGAAIDHGFAERTTFVITSDGKIAATIGGLSPTENVAKALEVVEQLSGKKS